jgi:two-component system CheB/CheR fusion protein
MPFCRILLIEDNVLAARNTRMLLSEIGYEVQLAHSGKEGIKIARRFQPEIVVCDIGLPDIDGFAVARELRQEQITAAAYLIALSGYGRAEDQRQALEAGFNVYITKPINMNKLKTMLSEAALTRGIAVQLN